MNPFVLARLPSVEAARYLIKLYDIEKAANKARTIAIEERMRALMDVLAQTNPDLQLEALVAASNDFGHATGEAEHLTNSQRDFISALPGAIKTELGN